MPRDFEALAGELEERFSAAVARPWSDADFGRLALRTYEHQFRHNPTYRRFCEGRRATPETVASWHDVPAVPTTAFKHVDLVSGNSSPVEAIFRTSGTTRSGTPRGRHLVPRLSLYRASLLPSFRAHVTPDTDRIAFVSLIPSPVELTESSLSYMVGAAAQAFATEIHWLVSADGSLDTDGLAEMLSGLASRGEPVLLLGTAFAFVHALDGLEGADLRPLPSGSRIMETGGFKGLVHETPRAELYERLSAATGLPTGRIVSEYGMTELLSQLYAPTLSEPHEVGAGYVPPPWLRVRALDPTTLEPVGEDEDGLLTFFDLANLGSICHVLTEDVGCVRDGRVRLTGRFPGAEPRGCSRAMEELMGASEAGR